MRSFHVLCAISLLAFSESISAISSSKITTLKVSKNVKNPGTIGVLRGGSGEHCFNSNIGSNPEPAIMCLTSNQLAQGGDIVSKSALPLVMWFGMAKLNEAAKGLNVGLNDEAGQLVVQVSGLNVGLNDKAAQLVAQASRLNVGLNEKASQLNEKAGKLLDDFKILIRSFQIFSAVFCVLFGIAIFVLKPK